MVTLTYLTGGNPRRAEVQEQYIAQTSCLVLKFCIFLSYNSLHGLGANLSHHSPKVGLVGLLGFAIRS